MTTGKTIALTIWTFVSKAMSMLFSTLSKFAKAFLPRSKHHLIFVVAVTICSDFGAQENKVSHCFQSSVDVIPTDLLQTFSSRRGSLAFYKGWP